MYFLKETLQSNSLKSVIHFLPIWHQRVIFISKHNSYIRRMMYRRIKIGIIAYTYVPEDALSRSIVEQTPSRVAQHYLLESARLRIANFEVAHVLPSIPKALAPSNYLNSSGNRKLVFKSSYHFLEPPCKL